MPEFRIDTSKNKDIEIMRGTPVGTILLLCGYIYSARDAAHKKIADSIIEGKNLFDFKDKILYYMGPTPARPGNPIGSCGPTSSYRMDSYLEMMLKLGVSATIGKGDRDSSVLDIIKLYKAPYLTAVGGASAYLAKKVKSSKVVLFPELGPEAVVELLVDQFPVIVSYDINERSIFDGR